MSVILPVRADATRTAIVETAERLFRTLGYRKTAVADIARELGMSPANVYRFFASKSAINEAITQRILGGMVDECWRIARGPGTASDRLRQLFDHVCRRTLELFFKEKQMHDMVTAAMTEHWPVIEDYKRGLATAIRHVLADGQADGSFAKLDLEMTADLVHATMIGFMHPAIIEQCGTPESLPHEAAAMADFVLRSLRK